MNLDFLTNTIIPKREQEILAGKNLGTRQPIYFVYDICEQYTTYDNEYSCLESCNLYGYKPLHGKLVYIDEDGNEIEDGDEKEFIEDKDGDVTKFFSDRYVALFFTKEGADDYIKYQKHNLSDKAYIYVHYTGYGNREMDQLLNNS